MKNISRHVGTLIISERMKNSEAGIPRYRIHVGGVNAVTKANSGLYASIRNYEGKYVDVTIGTHRGRRTLDTIRLQGES